MKIAHYVGIFTLAGATAFGCSSTPSGGSGTGFGDGTGNGDVTDDGGGSLATGSSSGGNSSGSSGSSGGSSGKSSSGGSSSGSSSGGHASSSGGMGEGGIITADAAPGSDPETDYSGTKTVTMDTFVVQPGSEVYYCQNFANPWGKQVDIKTYDLNMAAGSHHMFAFYQTNATNGAVAPCPSGGLTFGAFTFTSQTQVVSETYPATVGATIPATTGFNMMVHYLNTTSSPINAQVALTMYIAKPNVVTNHAGVIFLNNAGISVAATGQPVVTTSTFTLPQNVSIMTSSSHMHKFATNFVSTASSGQTLYTTTQWDEPKALPYSPPLVLNAGTTITWSCTDVNTTGVTLTFGESANSNVMCIAVDIFYPVSDVTNPVLGSAISGIL